MARQATFMGHDLEWWQTTRRVCWASPQERQLYSYAARHQFDNPSTIAASRHLLPDLFGIGHLPEAFQNAIKNRAEKTIKYLLSSSQSPLVKSRAVVEYHHSCGRLKSKYWARWTENWLLPGWDGGITPPAGLSEADAKRPRRDSPLLLPCQLCIATLDEPVSVRESQRQAVAQPHPLQQAESRVKDNGGGALLFERTTENQRRQEPQEQHDHLQQQQQLQEQFREHLQQQQQQLQERQKEQQQQLQLKQLRELFQRQRLQGHHQEQPQQQHLLRETRPEIIHARPSSNINNITAQDPESFYRPRTSPRAEETTQANGYTSGETWQPGVGDQETRRAGQSIFSAFSKARIEQIRRQDKATSKKSPATGAPCSLPQRRRPASIVPERGHRRWELQGLTQTPPQAPSREPAELPSYTTTGRTRVAHSGTGSWATTTAGSYTMPTQSPRSATEYPELKEYSRAMVMVQHSLDRQHEASKQAFNFISYLPTGRRDEEMWQEARRLEHEAIGDMNEAIKQASKVQTALEEKWGVEIPDILRADRSWAGFTTSVALASWNGGGGKV